MVEVLVLAYLEAEISCMSALQTSKRDLFSFRIIGISCEFMSKVMQLLIVYLKKKINELLLDKKSGFSEIPTSFDGVILGWRNMRNGAPNTSHF